MRAKQAAKLKREYASKRAELDREYRKKLKALTEIGGYEPTSRKLTKSRRRSINQRFRQFEEFLTGDSYIFVPIPTRSKAKRKKAIKLAAQNQLPTSRRGVFVPKTKRTVSAKAVYSRKTGTYRIKIKKKKTGLTGEKTVTEILPMEPLGTLAKELDRIKGDAGLLKLKKGESLAFKVTFAGSEGYGHKIFSSPELLIKYLESEYQKAIAHKLAFFRAVSVFKVKRETYFRDYPRPKANPYRNRRSRERAFRPGRI